MKKNDLKHVLILLLTAIIWGFAFSAQVEAAENGLGPFTFNGTRFLLGGFSLIPVALIFERRKLDRDFLKNTVLPGMLAGTVLFIASSLQQFGIQLTKSEGKASFITGFYIVLIPIFSLILFKQRTSVNVWIGAAFAFVGLYFLGITPGEKVALGDILVFIGAFMWTAHILVIDRFIGEAGPIAFSMVQFFMCGILGLICAFTTEDVTWAGIYTSKWAILYAGVLSSGVAYTCQTIGQKGTDPTLASIILSAEAMFGAISGRLVHDRVLGLRGVIGCAAMFIGMIVSQIPMKRKKEKVKKA